MWLMTNFGFFSIVRKPDDDRTSTLTVRARARADLEALRDQYLPDLGEIAESSSTDYRYRAKVPRDTLAIALLEITRDIDYDNFKSSVHQNQGGGRAHLYHEVWDVLYKLQHTEQAHNKPSPETASTSPPALPPNTSFGGVVFNEHDHVLLREPAGHYDGYVWTFPKGRPGPGTTAEEAALREVEEETGYRCEIIGRVPGSFRGGMGDNIYFLMRPVAEPQAPDRETRAIRWAEPSEARGLIGQTTNTIGRNRDLAVLDAAVSAYAARR